MIRCEVVRVGSSPWDTSVFECESAETVNAAPVHACGSGSVNRELMRRVRMHSRQDDSLTRRVSVRYKHDSDCQLRRRTSQPIIIVRHPATSGKDPMAIRPRTQKKQPGSVDDPNLVPIIDPLATEPDRTSIQVEGHCQLRGKQRRA